MPLTKNKQKPPNVGRIALERQAGGKKRLKPPGLEPFPSAS